MNNVAVSSPSLPSSNASQKAKAIAKKAIKSKGKPVKKTVAKKTVKKASPSSPSPEYIAPSIPAPSAPIVCASHIGNVAAILVRLSIPSIPSYKKDKEASASLVSSSHASDNSAIRVNKTLGSGDSLKNSVITAQGELRSLHKRLTAPFMGDSIGICRADNAEKILPLLREKADKVRASVFALAEGFERLIEADKAKLGSLFNPADYPSREELLSKANVELEILPLPSSHLLSGLVSETICREAEGLANQRITSVNQSLAERLRERVASLCNSLKGKKIHKSCISNLLETISEIQSLDFGNPDIANLVELAKSLSGKIDLEKVKDNESDKELAQKEAEAALEKIRSAMSAFAC